MNIVVLIKQVPDTTDVKIDPKTGTLIREGVPSIINPDDKHAIEEALRLKEEYGGKVTVISMGPPQAMDALRESKAMGVDDNILLSDRAFAGADTWATSYTLAAAIKKVGDYDIIICGRQAIDGDTAQVGPQVAECLDLPQITYVRKIELDGKTMRAERTLEDGFERIETTLPALITVIKDLNEPRYPSVRGIVEACREAVYPIWTAKDIDAEPSKIGLDGSPTQVKRSFAPEPHGAGLILEGTTEQMAKDLVAKLKDDNVVG
jgi:electron transfer flavoprotein beta subunit